MRQMIALVILLMSAAVFASPLSAQTGLQVRPLSYEATLERNQPQDGVVDVSNPSDEPVTVRVSVKGFRNGAEGLEFYDDQQLASGIQLDQDRIDLEGKGAYRLVFQADPSKLPTGDVRAAILFTTANEGEMVAQQVSVGTLLLITNGRVATATTTVRGDDGQLTRWVFGAIVLLLLAGLGLAVWNRRRKLLVFSKRP